MVKLSDIVAQAISQAPHAVAPQHFLIILDFDQDGTVAAQSGMGDFSG